MEQLALQHALCTSQCTLQKWHGTFQRSNGKSTLQTCCRASSTSHETLENAPWNFKVELGCTKL
eukprot:1161408-Pelagomonas_calceolata.AAC.1